MAGFSQRPDVSADGTLAYVATWQGDAVSVIDAQYIAFEPNGTAYTSAGRSRLGPHRAVLDGVELALLHGRAPRGYRWRLDPTASAAP